MLLLTGVITLAGVGAIRVQAVLIFFTWRRIFGALVYICRECYTDGLIY